MGVIRTISTVLLAVLLGAWDHGSITSQTGVIATRSQALVDSIGVGEPSGGTASTVYTDMSYLGVTHARDIVPFSGDGGGNYTALAADGIKFDFLFANDTYMTDGSPPATSLAATFALIDTLVTSYPGSVIGIEGPNEVHNFPVNYTNTATTNASTAFGNATLHFAATLPSVQTVASSGWGAGMVVTDTTHSGVIPSNTTVLSATATTVVLSANTTGVSNGDTITFSAVGVEPSTNPSVQASAIAWQQDIYNITHADSHLSGVPVINFTDYVPGQPNGGQIGVAGTADANNQHIYVPSGYPPWYYNNSSGAGYYIISGAPLWVTEYGFYTMLDNASGVDATTQARLYLMQILDMFNFGVAQTLNYQLIDSGCDAGNTNAQYHYGLFDGCSGNPKTAATAIKNLTALLADSTSFTPGQLNYWVAGLPPASATFPTEGGGYAMLFQKSNGRFYIPVWNEPQIWNATTNSEITPSTVNVTVNLGKTFTTVNVYDPITGSSPVNTYSGVNSVPLALIADPLIVEAIP